MGARKRLLLGGPALVARRGAMSEPAVKRARVGDAGALQCAMDSDGVETAMKNDKTVYVADGKT